MERTVAHERHGEPETQVGIIVAREPLRGGGHGAQDVIAITVGDLILRRGLDGAQLRGASGVAPALVHLPEVGEGRDAVLNIGRKE